MANIVLATTCSKFQAAGGMLARYSPLTSRVSSLGFSPLPFQQGSLRNVMAAAYEPAKRGANELKRAGCEMKDEAASAADNVTNKTKDVAGKAAGQAENVADKAKQTAQEAWGSAKDTAQNVKNTVVGKAEDSATFVKENADTVKRNMNSKERN